MLIALIIIPAIAAAAIVAVWGTKVLREARAEQEGRHQ
jgi:hypothetical protein